MEFGERNVYLATFDLVLRTADGSLDHRVITKEEPVAERYLVAADFEEAYHMAQEMRNDLRHGMVHKETAVRDITLQHTNVVVMTNAAIERQ